MMRWKCSSVNATSPACLPVGIAPKNSLKRLPVLGMVGDGKWSFGERGLGSSGNRLWTRLDGLVLAFGLDGSESLLVETLNLLLIRDWLVGISRAKVGISRAKGP
jgi:hypothetical protein